MNMGWLHRTVGSPILGNGFWVVPREEVGNIGSVGGNVGVPGVDIPEVGGSTVVENGVHGGCAVNGDAQWLKQGLGFDGGGTVNRAPMKGDLAWVIGSNHYSSN
ncbi:hypothetical protein Dimus_038041 [Dionaea muscipula]